jgi:SNF2 family DNA or RNA helicase
VSRRLIAHGYQVSAARYMITHPHSAVFADPGTGKTAISLMVISELKSRGVDAPILIVGPLRVITRVWPDEIRGWNQFTDLSYTVLHGPRKKTRLAERTDIHLINVEGLKWLSQQPGGLARYDVLILDESSKFKNWSADRTKIMRKVISGFSRRHILTGSPTPKSLLDLFPQMYLCDGGASLGRYLTHYRDRYFKDMGWGFPDWRLRKGAADEIYSRISGHCFRLDGEILLDMPELIYNDIHIELPPKVKAENRRRIASIDLDQFISAGNEYISGRRVSGGFTEGPDQPIHMEKLKALRDLVDELHKPALVLFYFRDEGIALSRIFKAPKIDGTTTQKEFHQIVDQWNAGDLPILLGQPAAMGHGLNLQHGGNDVIWYTLTDNQDDYYQANRRIYRQGVRGNQVRIHRLIADGTLDDAVLKSLEAKTRTQKALLDAIRDLRGES